MKYPSAFLSLLLLVLVTACGGGRSSTPASPSAAATYGIFRANKAVAAPAAALLAAPMARTGSISMQTPRVAHTATLLPNGEVLIAGGFTDPSYTPGNLACGTTSMELFDPDTEAFYPISGSLLVPRTGHAAVILDSGLVLFIGGDFGITWSGGTATLETFDPATGQSLMCGTLPDPGGSVYDDVTAYNLGSGKILIMGSNSSPVITTPTLVDTSLFNQNGDVVGVTIPTDGLHTVFAPASCQLQDGRVLISGGVYNEVTDTGSALLSSTEVCVFNPATSALDHLGNMKYSRSEHTMLDLGNGKVGIFGGQSWQTGSGRQIVAANSVEIFDCATGTSTESGAMAGEKYMMQSALLQNGMVLSSGGGSVEGYGVLGAWSIGVSSSQMVYDPSTKASGYTGDMSTPRVYFSMTKMNNGLFLAAGGEDAATSPLATAEIYDPLDHVYLTYPNPVLPYGGTETLTVTIPSGSPVTAPFTWAATSGAIVPAADGLSAAYTYPSQPAPVPVVDPATGLQEVIDGVPQTTQPVIAFDTITLTATSGEKITAVINLLNP